MEIACAYGKFDSFKALLAHNAKIDGDVLEKVVFWDEKPAKNQRQGKL